MKRSIIGWLVLLVGALVWEGLGLAGVGGVWPLTWDVREALNWNEPVAGLGIFLACLGFPAWLVWHFLAEKRRIGKQKLGQLQVDPEARGLPAVEAGEYVWCASCNAHIFRIVAPLWAGDIIRTSCVEQLPGGPKPKTGERVVCWNCGDGDNIIIGDKRYLHQADAE